MRSAVSLTKTLLVLALALPVGAAVGPIITSISQDHFIVNGPDTPVSVYGRRFTPRSQVFVGSSVVPTTFVSEGELTALVPWLLVSMWGETYLQVDSSNPISIFRQSPDIYGTSPTRARAGATSVTVTLIGAGFLPGQQIYVSSSSKRATLTATYLSSTSVSVVLPAEVLAHADTLSIRTDSPYEGFPFYVTDTEPTGPSPVISSVTPSRRYVAFPSGEPTILEGSGFTPESKVLSGTRDLGATYVSPTRLSLSQSTNHFRVLNPGGLASNPVEVKTIPTAITGLNPPRVVAGSGDFTIEIQGAGFTTQTALTGCGAGANFVNQNLLRVSVSAKSIASPGICWIGIWGESLQDGTSVAELVIEPAAVAGISSISPERATAGSSAFTLTINGQGFASGTTLAYTNAAGATGTLTIATLEATRITATIPAALVNDSDILTFSVKPPGGAVLTARMYVDPVVTSITPDNVSMGTLADLPVTIRGAGFGSGEIGIYSSTLGDTWLNFRPQSVTPNEIKALLPAGYFNWPGAYPVYVWRTVNSVGLSSVPIPFTIRPTITSLNPPAAMAGSAGFQLTVNSPGGGSVAWNGTPLGSAPTVNVPASLIATAGTARITLSKFGATSAAVDFPVLAGAALTQLSPAAKSAGEAGFNLTVTGTGFRSDASVLWNGQNVATTFVSATSLTAAIPAALLTTAGTATVTVSQGGALSNALVFTIQPPALAITSISPASVEKQTSFTLTVRGSGFVPGMSLLIGTTTLATTFVDSTQLTADVPPVVTNVSGGKVSVQVSYGASVSNAVDLAFILRPVVSTLTPSSAPAGGPGFSLVVLGGDFSPDTVVLWNGEPFTGSYGGYPPALTIQVPARLIAKAGTARITASRNGLESANSRTFTIEGLRLDTITPNEVLANGPETTVSITGTGFLRETVLQWNGTPLPISSYLASTSIKVRIPAALQTPPGTYNLYLENPDGTRSNTVPFTVRAPETPVLTSLAPSSAPAGSGYIFLKVLGTGISSNAKAYVDGEPPGYLYRTPLSFQMPVAKLKTPGEVRVWVVSDGITSNTLIFTVTEPPKIASISPLSVKAGSGDFDLTITGSGFTDQALVQWNGQALSTTRISSTQLKAAIPATRVAYSGNGAITVVADGITSAPVTFVVDGDMIIRSVTPSLVRAGGPAFTLTAEGSGFTAGTILRFDTVDLVTTFVSAERLTATVPASLIAKRLSTTVLAVQGTSRSAPVTVEVWPVPILRFVEPGFLTAGVGDTALLVDAYGIDQGSVVRWNGQPIPARYSAVHLDATVPAALLANPGTAEITVVNPGELVSNVVMMQVYPATPVITSIGPDSASAGTTARFTLVVRGQGFQQGSVVKFAGTVLVTDYRSPGHLEATLSPELLAAAGTAPVTVLNPNGRESAGVPFTIRNDPRILRVSPDLLTFTAAESGVPTAAQTVSVTSPDGSAIAFTGWANCTWARITPTSATTPATVAITADPAGLTPGSRNCPVTFEPASTHLDPNLQVTLNVTAAGLHVEPQSLALTVAKGQSTPVVRTLAVSGTTAAFTATVAAGAPWLTVSPASGAVPGEIAVQINAHDLAAGDYTTSVYVDSQTRSVVVPVSVHVTSLPVLAVAPESLRFHVAGAAAEVPAQVLSVLTSADVRFQSEVTGPLKVTEGPGARNLSVSVATDGLEPGSVVAGSVRVRAEGTAPEAIDIPVEVRVDALPVDADPLLAVVPESAAFSFGAGAGPATTLLAVSNQGGGSVDLRAVASKEWLTVSPAEFTLSTATSLVLTADPSKLPASGSYDAEVSINSADGKQSLSVPVTITLSDAPALVLSRMSLRVTAVKGNATPPAEALDIALSGAGTANWMIQPMTESGEPWLSVGPGSGVASEAEPVSAQVLVDASNLEPGLHQGSIIVFAPKTANVRQTAQVTLEVLPTGSPLSTRVLPAALIVSGTDQTVTRTLTVHSGSALTYTSAAVTDDGAAWCALEPSSGSVDPGASLNLQLKFAGLAAGAHRCSLRILFGDGALATVTAMAVVPGETCGDGIALLRAPAEGFRVRAGEPVNLELELTDNCGAPIDRAAVMLRFSNGDAPVTLLAAGKGIYRGSWTPVNAASTVTIEPVIQGAGAVQASPVSGTVTAPN